MLESGIYRITNIKNGKCYIGQSRFLSKRWKGHLKELRANRHGNQYLQAAFNKYGEKSFKFEIICRCEESELDDLEKYYIVFSNSLSHDCGYNIESGGCKHKTMSEESRKKISEKAKGRKMPEKVKKILAEANKNRVWPTGWHVSEETKLKMSKSHKGLCAGEKHPMYGLRGKDNPNYGRKASEECRRKISEKAKGRVFSEETRKKISQNNARHNLGKHLTLEQKRKIVESRGKNFDLEDAIQEYLKCGKYLEAAQKCNVGTNRLREELKKRGLIKKRTLSEEQRQRLRDFAKSRGKDMTEAIQDYFENHISIWKISKKYHLSRERLKIKINSIKETKAKLKIQQDEKSDIEQK